MAVDYFLKIDGIDGESTDHKHSKEIELESWNWGESQLGAHAGGSGGGAGKVSMQDFQFTFRQCKASPLLFLHCANGKHIPKAVLTCRKAGEKQQDYFVMTLCDLLVSSYQTGGSAGAEIALESVSLNFTKIEFAYCEQKKDGGLEAAIKAGYDLKKNAKI